MYLSKSKYCSGMQCPKILWMDSNMPEQKAEIDTYYMEAGSMVGDIAMGYFGDYTEIPFDRDKMGEMISETIRQLEAGTEHIAEASFSFDGNFCSVDILKKTKGGYEIIEVKSTSASENENPDKIKEVHLNDMAYQYYVLANCGINITKVSLMRINKDYVRQGALDVRDLFFLQTVHLKF